ncbi:unnamed protein product [Xylocopa violacea]
MKNIVALFLVCSVADAAPYWGLLHHRYTTSLQPPQLPSFQPMSEHTHQHSYHTPEQPKYTTSWPSYQLDNIRLQVIQDCSPKDKCSLAVLCRNPVTGVMMITEISSAALSKQNEKQSESRSAENLDTQYYNDNNNNKDADNGDFTITTPHTSTPEPQMVTEPSFHGGEGLLDVRFGGD